MAKRGNVGVVIGRDAQCLWPENREAVEPLAAGSAR